MRKDTITRFAAIQNNLLQERNRLKERLSEISTILNIRILPETRVRQAETVTRKRRRKNQRMSLRTAVLKVTAKKPLTKAEIINAVQDLGYRFRATNPINSLNVLLYGKNPKFRNEGGRFSPI